MLKLFRCVVASIALGLSGWLHAGVLVQYSYTDPYGQTKTALPETVAANPSGDMAFILAAGIDRRVRITLYRGSSQLATAESPPLTGDDRITVAGVSYYGATLVLPAPDLDGHHTLRAEILDHEGNLISREEHDVLLDRQPPVMSGGFAYFGDWPPNTRDPLQPEDLVSSYAVQEIIARGVADAHAGLALDGARFQSIYLEGPNSGQVAYDTPAVFSGTDLVVGTGYAGSVARGVHLPVWDGALLLRFVAFDRVGNAASFDIPVLFDGEYSGKDVQLLAVYNPASSNNPVPGSPYVGYELYTPGMTVHTNPAQLLVRVPKSAWWEYNATGILLHAEGIDPWPSPADYVDANYAYKVYRFGHRPVNELPAEGLFPEFRVAAPTVWAGDPPVSIRPDLVLAPEAPPTPALSGLTLQYANAGTVVLTPTENRYKSNQVDTLTRVTLTVAPRPYDQIAYYHGSCAIPAGATQCSHTPNSVYGDTADGMEAVGYTSLVTNSDGTLRSTVGLFLLVHDTRPPVIATVTPVAENSQLDVRLSEYLTGNWWNTVGMERVWGEAAPTGGGAPVTLAHSMLRSLGVDEWQALLPLTDVPDGEYTVTVYAQDNVGNQSAPKVITQVVVDHTPPTAAFFVDGGATLGSAPISDIGDIYFRVTDQADPAPRVLSASIAGGPLGDDVRLGFYLQSGVYRVEYPVMLPSLSEEDYTLTVTLRDASGNEATAVQPFTFEPPHLGLTPENGADIRLPLLNEAVAVRLDNGNWPLTSTPVVLSDAGGMPITGTANLLVAWSTDARCPLLVDGQRLEPGARLNLPDYDFDRARSRLELPLALDVEEQEAVAQATGFRAQINSANTEFSITIRVPAPYGDDVTYRFSAPLMKSLPPLINNHPVLGSLITAVWKSPRFGIYYYGSLELTSNKPGLDGAFVVHDLYSDTPETPVPVTIPAQDGGLPDPGRVGTLIIQIERPEAPAFVEEVQAWSPAAAMVIVPDEAAYARQVQYARIGVTDSGEGYCRRIEGLLDPGTTRATSVPDGTPRCAVHWSGIPTSLSIHPLTSTQLVGYLDSPDAEARVGYQPGMMVAQNGSTRFIPAGGDQSALLPLFDATPPVLLYAPVSTLVRFKDWLPAGVWPTTPGTTTAGVAHAKSTPYSGLTLRISDEASGRVLEEVASATDYARALIRTELARVEDVQTVNLRAYYTRHPDIFSEATVSFSALPNRLALNLVRPPSPTNLTPVVLEGYFGEYAGGAYRYDADAMGAWQMQIYHVTRDAEGAIQRTPLGTPTTTIGADGRFEIDLGQMAPGRYRLEVSATFLGRTLVMENAITGVPLTLQVEDGSPVTCGITPNVEHGPQNLVAILKLAPVGKRYADISAVAWERSTDQTNWTPVTITPPKPRAYGFNERLTETGHYYYRATTTNRHSGEQALCEPGHIQVYAPPKVTLDGPTFTFVDHPVTWTAVAAVGEAPLEYRWRVRRTLTDETPLTSTDASLELPADIIGTWYIELQARHADAPDKAARAWTTVRATLHVQAPRMIAPRIEGERFVELGKSYTYTAKTFPLTYPIYSLPADLVVAGEWVLPDGTTQTGDTLTYTPATTEPQTLKYRAWVNGYRDVTQREATLALRTWVYAFPTFTLVSKVVKHYDPVRKQYTVRQGQSVTGDEDFTFTWNFPTAAGVEQPHERYATASFATVGQHRVSVRVSDTRGNAVVLEDVVEVTAPPPLTASSRIVVGDSWNRAPAPVTVYWYVNGLLTQERVKAVHLALDDQPMGQGLSSYYRVDVAEPGPHTVSLSLETDYGRQATHTADVTLVQGEPPTCSLQPTGDGVTQLKVKINCTLTMGRVAKYRWLITYADAPAQPEDPGMSSYSALNLSAAQLARGVLAVEGVAINDKDQESAPALWRP